MPSIFEQAKRKAIFGPSTDECRTDRGDQLCWMGGSSLHQPPQPIQPSPLQYPAKVQIPTGPTTRSQPFVPTSDSWDSPTDIIFYHHHPSCTTICHSLESTVSRSLQSYEAEATVQRADACVLGQARPQLLKLTVEPVVSGDDEVLPFTPGTPDKMKGWTAARGLSASTPKAVGIPAFNAITSTTQTGEPVLVHSLSPRQYRIIHPIRAPVSPDSPRTELFTPQEACHPFGPAADEMSVDTGCEEDEDTEMEMDRGTFGERSTMQELVERTGMVAKRARHGSA
ncbi:hypothetical protein IAT38_002275 [Cryptococcus sp. DSM 104549]